MKDAWQCKTHGTVTFAASSDCPLCYLESKDATIARLERELADARVQLERTNVLAENRALRARLEAGVPRCKTCRHYKSKLVALKYACVVGLQRIVQPNEYCSRWEANDGQ